MKVPKPIKLKCGDSFINLRLGGENITVRAKSEKECIRQATKIKADYLADNRQKRASTPILELTLGEAIDAYNERYAAALSPATIRGYDTIRRTRFKRYMVCRIKSIKDWQQMINDETGLCSPKTIKNAWGCVRAVLKDGKLSVPKVKLPKPVPHEHEYLDPEDHLSFFLSAVRGSKYEIPILMALLSLRRSEIFAVTWDDVDLRRKTIRVAGAIVPDKNGKYVSKAQNKNETSTRTVRIEIPQLIDALSAVPEERRTGPVCTCHPNTIYKVINKICEDNQLPKVGTHGLRHTYASIGYLAGVPEKEMQKSGGWKDPTTMHRIYEHIGENQRLKSTTKMEAFFAAASYGPQNANENANG